MRVLILFFATLSAFAATAGPSKGSLVIVGGGKLVTDVLDVSRMITGHTRLQLSPQALPRILADAVESVRPAAPSSSPVVLFSSSSMARPTAGALRGVSIQPTLVASLVSPR